jgi:hypothetical protein
MFRASRLRAANAMIGALLWERIHSDFAAQKCQLCPGTEASLDQPSEEQALPLIYFECTQAENLAIISCINEILATDSSQCGWLPAENALRQTNIAVNSGTKGSVIRFAVFGPQKKLAMSCGEIKGPCLTFDVLKGSAVRTGANAPTAPRYNLERAVTRTMRDTHHNPTLLKKHRAPRISTYFGCLHVGEQVVGAEFRAIAAVIKGDVSVLAPSGVIVPWGSTYKPMSWSMA